MLIVCASLAEVMWYWHGTMGIYISLKQFWSAYITRTYSNGFYTFVTVILIRTLLSDIHYWKMKTRKTWYNLYTKSHSLCPIFDIAKQARQPSTRLPLHAFFFFVKVFWHDEFFSTYECCRSYIIDEKEPVKYSIIASGCLDHLSPSNRSHCS